MPIKLKTRVAKSMSQSARRHHYVPQFLLKPSGEDQTAVRQLFSLVHQYCAEHAPSLQIIVADHVELLEGWFRESIAERWRDGIALVPPSWLQD